MASQSNWIQGAVSRMKSKSMSAFGKAIPKKGITAKSNKKRPLFAQNMKRVSKGK